MKNRLIRTIKNTIAILCLGIFLYILYNFHIRIPCAFKTLTHLDCPSCGVSRMCVALSHGDIKSAFYQIRYIKTGQRKISPIENNIMIVLIVILIIYGIIRNLPFYPYRLP